MSSPRDWIRRIADVPTVNEHTLTIGAQFQVGPDGSEHRLILIGDDAISVDRYDDLIDAIDAAVEALNAA